MNCNKIFTCKHCELILNSNNKLHNHVRLHHKIFDKTLRQRFVEEKSKHINLLVTFVFVTILINSSIKFFISLITFKSTSTSTKQMKTQAACFNTSSTDFLNTLTNLAALIICLKLT